MRDGLGDTVRAVTFNVDPDTVRQALSAGEFFLLYQPIVALRDRRCVGAEALIRWRRDGTIIEAVDFMPQIESTPLSGTITYWVMDTVASELGPWLTANGDALIGINVPPEILGRGGIEYVASKSGLRALAKQVVLEITERGVPDQLGLDALNAVPTTGARVALDDTTLSGANLALLTRCHFDFVKIDHSLVEQLQGGQRPQWLDGLTALLGATSLQIIAEGVELESQAATLAAAGVQFAQGHWFSPGLPARELERYYAGSQEPGR
jgi:sensor c-di-GMP phosphodiesterase-like protein